MLNMENGIPVTSVPPATAPRNGPSEPNNFAAAAAAAAALASQHHFFNAVLRAAAASAAPSNAARGDHGSGESTSPLSVQLDYAPEAAEAKLIDYKQEKVAAFDIDGETMMCLPQAYELFLKNLVGGLHTVYTKLKRLEIAPFVCNVEQVRALRSIGAIQPGVNRCKLISCRDFDILYDDCASSSSRPGRPPKRSPVFTASSSTPAQSNIATSGSSSLPANNGYIMGGALGAHYGVGGAALPSDGPPAKRFRANEPAAVSSLDKFVNPMANFGNTSAIATGNTLNSNHLFPMFPFVPQNLMFNHFMNANSNASLLAKHWGDHLGAFSPSGAAVDNSTPLDATTKSAEERPALLSANGPGGGNRSERYPSFTSNSGRDSDECAKSSNGEALRCDNVTTSGAYDGRRSEENEEFNEANHSPAEDLELKDEDKDENSEVQASQWAAAQSIVRNAGTEASQLLRSMVNLGVSSHLFASPQLVAAAGGLSQETSPQRGEEGHSSVESILFSVLGLVQVAASTARLREEQLAKEKVEAVNLYETEKRERTRIEKLLRAERHAKVYLKRFRRERKQKQELTTKMMAMAEEAGKQQHSAYTSASSTTALANNAVKPANITQASRSTSSAETCGSFLPSKGLDVSWTSYSEMLEDHYKGRTSDSSQLDNRRDFRASSSGSLENSELTEHKFTRTSVAEECVDARERGRTATLFIKHALS